VTGSAGALTFSGNRISHTSSGFYFYAGQGVVQHDIRLISNRLDHLHAPDLAATGAGQCVTIAGGRDQERDFVLTGNVCGPGIGDHYVQVGGVTGLTIEHNTFLGPADPEALTRHTHNNVLQVFGDSRDVTFSHNVIRATQSRGQTVLIQEGRFDHVAIDGNLWHEDPRCLTDTNCFSYAIEVYNAHGLSFQDNTIVDSRWGVLLTDLDPRSYTSGTDYRVTRNIVVGAVGNPDINFQYCAVRCVFDDNVTGDRSAHQDGAQRYVVDWTPSWQAEGPFVARGLPFAAGYRKAG
jgi:hypothetical protein